MNDDFRLRVGILRTFPVCPPPTIVQSSARPVALLVGESIRVVASRLEPGFCLRLRGHLRLGNLRTLLLLPRRFAEANLQTKMSGKKMAPLARKARPLDVVLSRFHWVPNLAGWVDDKGLDLRQVSLDPAPKCRTF
jgi:hypothetical protein